MMTAGGPSAFLVPQQTKWELAFFSRPPISVFPSCRERCFLAGRPATGRSSPARFVTFAPVRPDASILTHLFASSTKTHLPTCFVSRPPAELGLLSLLFVVSMFVDFPSLPGVACKHSCGKSLSNTECNHMQAMGAFLSVAVISLPTMNAFRRLAVSMENLSKVASEEVPGTLSSLKLSGLEINDLTQQLSGLRLWGLQRCRMHYMGTNLDHRHPS
ncbi:hypothetical protein EJ110_NYTH12105 [Nymphaea thermarum]|nr:hypothetical protein EJ110_NYTH12105 [Nymphaea thermarum]